MKKQFMVLLSVLAIGFVLVASCPPNIPVTYYGKVSYNGHLLTGNYAIKAILNKDIVGSDELSNGNYYLDVTPCYGISSGEISFVINDVEAKEKVQYNTDNWGKEIELKLTLDARPSEENVCGNGYINPGEECDDGNSESRDGCSFICAIEYGYKCTGQPSICVYVGEYCGDGICNNGETCSSCSQDCGSCSSNNNVGSPGGSPSGSSTTQTNEKIIKLNIETENDENTNLISNENQETSSGITGAVIGFVKSGGGIGLIFTLLIIGIGVMIVRKRTSKNE